MILQVMSFFLFFDGQSFWQKLFCVCVCVCVCVPLWNVWYMIYVTSGEIDLFFVGMVTAMLTK